MRNWLYEHTIKSDMFWITGFVAFMFFLLIFGLWLTRLLSPETFTETCAYQYRNTPISQVPAGCINRRGGLR